MTKIEELLSISSAPLAGAQAGPPRFLEAHQLGAQLFHMLQMKNGFYAFENALHVFPITADPNDGLEGWNAESLWRSEYHDLARELVCFAEDAFQDQFCLSPKGVVRFISETGETEFVSVTVEKWAHVVLSRHEVETGWPLAREWQRKNGPLPEGKRLMPKIPFFVGGEYEIDNLWVGDASEGMRFKANMAMKTRTLPDGAKITLKITS